MLFRNASLWLARAHERAGGSRSSKTMIAPLEWRARSNGSSKNATRADVTSKGTQHLIRMLAQLRRRPRRTRPLVVERDRQPHHLRATARQLMHQVDGRELRGRGEFGDVVHRAARHACLLESLQPLGARLAAHGGGDQGKKLVLVLHPAPRSWRSADRWPIRDGPAPARSAPTAGRCRAPGRPAGRPCRRAGRARSPRRRCRGACGTVPSAR